MIPEGNARPRPAGVTTAALALLLASAYLFALAALSAAGRAPLAWGAYLLEGLELRGPVIFVAAALASSAAGIGLLGQRNWARRLTCGLAAALMMGAVPAVSSAVIDFRFWTLLREGVKVVGGTAAWFYLTQPETRSAFVR